jgi:hypothetical protein
MNSHTLEREIWVPTPIEEVFAFFSDASNLETMTPDWLRFEIATPTPIAMRAGAMIEYRIRWRFVALRWLTEIVEWSPPFQFVDVQVRGPYKLWHHTHEFEAIDGGTLVRDAVRYVLPLGPLGRVAHQLAVRRDLERVFDYRTRRIVALFGRRSAAAVAQRVSEN